MAYVKEDLDDLYDLFNVNEFTQATPEIWNRATDLQQQLLRNRLNDVFQLAGERIEDNLYQALPSELQTGKRPYKPPHLEVGKALGLFAGTINGRARGTSRRFHVRRNAAAGNNEPEDELLEPFRDAFRAATLAAIRIINQYACVVDNNSLTALWLPDETADELSFSFEMPPGHAPTRPVAYTGDSIGLTLGICAFSVLTGAPIPTEFACTGTLNEDGNTGPVTQTQAKVDSLLIEHPEVTTILVATGSDPVTLPLLNRTDIALVQVSTLEEALHRIFAAGGGVQKVVETFVSASRGAQYSLSLDWEEKRDTSGRKVLVTEGWADNIDARILRHLNAKAEPWANASTGKTVVIDGRLPVWFALFVGGYLANRPLAVAFRQASAQPKATNATKVAFVGWVPQNPDLLGTRIEWEG